uniref:RING-type domain-containing protein n=1 Tax=Romanomermis culicivorax TaxID=13658 RepID=A0A915K400_ROMCU
MSLHSIVLHSNVRALLSCALLSCALLSCALLSFDNFMVISSPICSICDRPVSDCSQSNKFYVTPSNESLCQQCHSRLRIKKIGNSRCLPNPEMETLTEAPLCYMSLTSMKECLTSLATTTKGLKCPDCENDVNRWPVHPCDYVECRKCASIICPFCALEKHRDHDVRSVAVVLQKRKQMIWESAKKIRSLLSKVKAESKEISTEINASLAYFSHLKDQIREGIDEYERAEKKMKSNEIKIREFIRNFDNGKSMNENRSMISTFVGNIENFAAVQQKWNTKWFDTCKNVETIKTLLNEWKA